MPVLTPLPRLWTSRRTRPAVCPRCARRSRIYAPKPRVLPSWRRGVAAVNAAGDRLIDADGNRYVDASGNRLLVATTPDDCACCGGACIECATEATVTFSGVTCCHSGCVSASGANLSNHFSGTNWDGTYSLAGGTNGLGGCSYAGIFASPVTQQQWELPGCGGALLGEGTSFQIRLEFSPGTLLWTLGAVMVFGGGGGVFGSAGFYAPGCDTDPFGCDAYCWTKSGIANTQTCQTAPINNAGHISSGGTATVTVG